MSTPFAKLQSWNIGIVCKPMTLEEAIKHCEEKAIDCLITKDCAAAHKQLALWLTHYQWMLEQEKQENVKED